MARFLFFLTAVVVTFSAVQCEVVQEGNGCANASNSLVFLGSSVNAVPGRLRSSTTSQESLYYHSTNNAGFAAARSDCEIIGATLLMIETKEELANVTKYLESSDETAFAFWVGAGYDTSKGDFMWENGVRVGTWAPWAPGYPNSKTRVTKVAINRDLKFQSQFQTQSTRYLCEKMVGYEAAQPCFFDNHLVIVVESSGSIGQVNYMAALEFTAKLAVAWADHPGNRISVVIYADYIVSVINMNEVLSPSQIRNRVYKAPYYAGSTFTDRGLNMAIAQIMSSNKVVPKNIVVLTAGISTNPQATIASAQAAHKAGCRTFAVGITNSANQGELLAIAGNNPNRVFNTASFQELSSLLQPVSRQVCS